METKHLQLGGKYYIKHLNLYVNILSVTRYITGCDFVEAEWLNKVGTVENYNFNITYLYKKSLFRCYNVRYLNTKLNIELGSEQEDSVLGVKGKVTAYTVRLDSSNRVCLEYKVSNDVKAFWTDITRLKSMNNKPSLDLDNLSSAVDKIPGGPSKSTIVSKSLT